MARQQQQQQSQRQPPPDRKRATTIPATELLNFHFSTSPPQQSRPTLSSPDGGRRNHNQRSRPGQQQQQQQQQQQHHHPAAQQQHHNRQQQQRQQQRQQRRSMEDRASARRKPSSAMFFLHSSADHAFVLTRRVKPGVSSLSYTFSGSDEPVTWESVRLVKYLAPAASATTAGATATTGTTAAVVDAITNMTASCPICLDSLMCARITKCGHCFCLTCLLRHVHSHTSHNVYTHVKCPCCGIPLHMEDVRPVVTESVQPPRVGSTMTLVKLHRAKHCPAPYLPHVDQRRHASPHAAPCITDADAPYSRFNYLDPISYQVHLESDESVLQKELATVVNQREKAGENYHLDTDILFYTLALEIVQKDLQKAREEAEEEQALLDRFDAPSSGIYQPQPPALTAKYYFGNVESSSTAFATTTTATATLPAANQEVEHEMFAMDSLHQQQQQHDQDEYIRHRRDSVGSESVAHEEEEYKNEMTDNGGHRRYRGDSIGSELSSEVISATAETPTTVRRVRSESITSHGSMESDRVKQQQQQQQPPKAAEYRPVPDLPASMYLDHDATHFYQSTDGQLCFLSGFNMTCLLSDFSTWPPSEKSSSTTSNTTTTTTTPFQRRKVLPLPDVVEGRVVETENVHLTVDMRKRMPFLSHLPLYIDVCFVELDLNHILSDVTKIKLKPEFEKRRRRRKTKAESQKRADRLAKKKEEERINELKARMQRIDPNDDFFRVPPPEDNAILTGEDFGPSLVSSTTSNAEHHQASTPADGGGSSNAVVAASPPKGMTFSQICRARVVASPPVAAPREEFPTLGSALASTTTSGHSTTRPLPPAGWNDRVKAAYAATKPVEEAPSAITDEQQLTVLPGGAKKKSKGKKIVLFSTGGQRGSAS